SVVDCNRVCNPRMQLHREACEQRIAGAGSQSCASDDDCMSGTCRKESIGSVCVDAIGCAEDGHCGAGSACLFDPDARDARTSHPTTLGRCGDGRRGSRCYEDSQCVYGHCQSELCSGGLDGDACAFNSNCASGFCRITSPTAQSGSCVSGKQGGSCTD